MIYIASPYSSVLVGQAGLDMQRIRFEKARTFLLDVMASGHAAFSPIVYCHPLVALDLRLGTDAKFWHNFNTAFLRKSEAVFVLRLQGWEQSKGVSVELKLAEALNIPVVHYGEDFKLVH